jgi:hypothetical protein
LVWFESPKNYFCGVLTIDKGDLHSKVSPDTKKICFDFVTVERKVILHHDFPERVMADQNFKPVELPVSADHLRQEGLGEAFVTYMRRWKNFVSE